MTRTVTAVTHWRTTCSVTPAMSRGWRKDPRLQPSTSTTSSQRHSGDAGPGLPGEGGVCRVLLGGPQSWGSGRRGTGQVPVCVEGTFPLSTAVCTPHQVHVFPRALSPIAIPSTSRSGRCSGLHTAQDTRLGLCDWTRPTPWK